MIQNMLLTATSLGLGACWIGEIAKDSEEVKLDLGILGDYELLAAVSIGVPAEQADRIHRKTLEECVLIRK